MIIAELGLNHQGDEAEVYKLLDSFLSTSIDAVTMQVREADYYKQTKNEKYFLDDSVYTEAAQKILLKKKRFGIALSDPAKVDFFTQAGASFFKVLSKDINNYRLLEKIASTGKDVYISTGLSDFDEIQNAVDFFKKHGVVPVLNHTALTYSPEMINLKSIIELKNQFKLKVSYGNHSPYLENSFYSYSF